LPFSAKQSELPIPLQSVFTNYLLRKIRQTRKVAKTALCRPMLLVFPKFKIQIVPLKIDAMKTFYAVLAVFFILGSILEYFSTYKEHQNYYSLKDFKSSLMLMLTALIVDLGSKIVAISLLDKLSFYSIWSLGYDWWVWISCYILWDFVFYVKHYLEHNVRFMWAIHVNHHSSEYMNLSTSLRSGVFKASYRYFFWAIPILIGFPLPMFLILYGLGKVWAFFSHSQRLGNWGILEKYTITPTHHNLHHSSNEDNLNKNFGETFLIWDKLFKTYKETNKPLSFGINEKINHDDFKEVVFHEFRSMVSDFLAAKNWRQKFKIVFGKP
jgi:sterol desaturase/sphingolipid hydroxylase (fatty acid hydroxylase superfamily)